MTDAFNNPYLRDAVLTAPPEQLQMMLYDGAIRFAAQGRDAIEAEDHQKAYDALTRAQKIVLELINGLREEVDPPLVKQVSSIYMFIYRKLVEANVNKDAAVLDDALKLLRYQRDTWSLLLEKLRAEQAQSSSPPPAATVQSPLPAASGARPPRTPPTAETGYRPISVEG
ncbi:MAG: flagellar export chaperone FliS [Phycisphaerales bacterium]|nr:MAG: flagellar export chaperone FliS [Phycisphaerales bacterium]